MSSFLLQVQNIIKDENWTSGKDHTTEEYKNKLGQIILKRSFNNNDAHDTYYVYDDFGNLTYVLPPEASRQIVDEGLAGFRISSQTNYPWTDLVLVDKVFAEDYNKKLVDYENDAILNADIQNQYGGHGGFTINTHENQDLVTLSVTFSADTPFALKQGELVSLKNYGEFKDTELGKINGTDFEYVFLIKNNTIIIEKSGKGDGKLTSINEMFNSNIKLSYTQNYPWTTYTDVDPKFAAGYEKQLSAYPNSDILGVNIPNEYGGQGGLNITIDENDNVLLAFNSTTTTPLNLKQGIVLPLNAKRKIKDRGDFETFQGYTFSIKDNALHIAGKQVLTSFIFTCGTPAPALLFTTVEGLCYIYHYDHRNRLVEKKIPGKDWEYIIYDTLDRPIMTQQANQRDTWPRTWNFTKYDAFNRVVYTGLYENNSLNRANLQQFITNQMNGGGVQLNEIRTSTNTFISSDPTIELFYTNDTFPNEGNRTIHSINYFDNYDDINLSTDLVYQDSYVQDLSGNNKNLSTVSKIRVLETDDWITSAVYYDTKTRPIFTVNKNDYLNTLDFSKIKLDFIGKVIEKTTQHQKTGQQDITTIDAFTYDHAQRLLTQTQTINGNTPELIVNNHYDELGQIESKNVGGTVANIPEDSQGLQVVDYTYNIRGWLKTINNGTTVGGDLFGFDLKYNDLNVNTSTAQPLYNGNISATKWQTANDNKSRSYFYGYDALNRITNAAYDGDYLLNGSSETENFSVENISYDTNGNIITLNRFGTINTGTPITDFIDKLSYEYAPNSNKLMAVTDLGSDQEGFKDKNTSSNDYQYDSNGNLTKDLNKGIISIEYNHLNLPTRIQFDNISPQPDGTISYTYDATGIKLEKTVSTIGSPGSIATQYAGNFIYENRTTNTSGGSTFSSELKLFNQPEGYVEPTNTGFQYIYQYKDHLGNIRLSYKKDYAEVTIDDFNDGTTGSWSAYSSTISNESNQLKVQLSDAEVGVVKTIAVTAGEEITISLNLDKGSTDKVSLYEYNDGELSDLNDGYNQISYTPTNSGDFYLLIVKDPLSNDVGTETYFYVDNVEVTNGEDNIEIVEENNYYPFGLKHKGYNDFINGTENNFKDFQGQELTKDLGLNVHEWKYRVSDPAIGRFWQIDPLAEDYYYNSTYAFSENRVIDSAELEGLERIHAADGKFINQIGTDDSVRVLNKNADINTQALIDTANNKKLSSKERTEASNILNKNSSYGFTSVDDAAINFSYNYHGEAQYTYFDSGGRKEIGAAINSVILKNKDGSEFLGTQSLAFIYGDAVTGESRNVNTEDMIDAANNKPGKLAGFAHTHQGQNKYNNKFSMGGGQFIGFTDQTSSEFYKVPVFMSNDDGQVRRGDFHLNPYAKKEGEVIYTFPSQSFKKH